MMRTYCSLADSRYLPQLLALYASLDKHSSRDFELNILALDNEAAGILSALQLRNVFILPPDTFRRLTDRTYQEWCWTCASQLCAHLMWMLNIPDLTYLDADMLFFSDPEIIFEEIGDKSIAMIPHRFNDNDQRRRLEANGKFNVCWNTFRNTDVGRACLSKWAAQCREWCYYRNEDGKFGDQKYLDSWEAEYGDEVHVIENIGAGVAPWNLSSYNLGILSHEKYGSFPCVNGVPIVFFHYHEYIHESRLTNYPLRQVDRDLIYAPYIEAINAAKARIESIRQLT